MANKGTYRPARRRSARNLRTSAIALAVTAAVLCVVAAISVWLAFFQTSSTSSTGPIGSESGAIPLFGAAEESSVESGLPRSGKLDGADETVDDNGIVHGTTPDGISYMLYGRDQAGAQSDKVTFAAVGDMFATDMNFRILARYGEASGIDYDFSPYYQGVSEELGAYDLRFINQETPCAGTDDGHSYSGYPVFNTPDSAVHALAGAGFNISNFASNHTWDQNAYGIERTQGLYAEHPEVMLIGSYASDEDRSVVRMAERNGATIAFLGYTYGDNNFGSDPDAFPNTYYACPFDEDAVREDVSRAQQVADAVVVYMHWGTEYDSDPNDQQLEYAQFLADLDVDLVIGSHAHILQPARYFTSQSGKQVPVMFGLSDFITGWTITDTIISGAFTCDFAWDGSKLAVENCAFVPAIEWSDGGDVYVRFLKDMTDDEIAANTRTEDVDDDVAYLHEFIDGLGMEVPVAW